MQTLMGASLKWRLSLGAAAAPAAPGGPCSPPNPTSHNLTGGSVISARSGSTPADGGNPCPPLPPRRVTDDFSCWRTIPAAAFGCIPFVLKQNGLTETAPAPRRPLCLSFLPHEKRIFARQIRISSAGPQPFLLGARAECLDGDVDLGRSAVSHGR